jgi:hypothetical protein
LAQAEIEAEQARFEAEQALQAELLRQAEFEAEQAELIRQAEFEAEQVELIRQAEFEAEQVELIRQAEFEAEQWEQALNAIQVELIRQAEQAELTRQAEFEAEQWEQALNAIQVELLRQAQFEAERAEMVVEYEEGDLSSEFDPEYDPLIDIPVYNTTYDFFPNLNGLVVYFDNDPRTIDPENTIPTLTYWMRNVTIPRSDPNPPNPILDN